ncbi:MAG TPA: DUF6599 family protein, partial [Pyrinomonadaceae bacterium]|nr:DUF6599 family protein [Pyrinomonadaceae bacterium]
MRFILLRLVVVSSFLSLLFLTAAGQSLSSQKASNLLPKTVGDFQAQGLRPSATLLKELAPEDFRVQASAEATYLSPKGGQFTVTLIKTESQAGAYALLTEVSARMRSKGQAQATKDGDIGIAGIASSDRVAFYKGPVFVSITGSNGAHNGESGLLNFARAFAGTLQDAENEIPVLVKHLPDWETAKDRSTYAISLHALKSIAGEQPVFEAVNFDEGEEAVTATYDRSRLVIIEYPTPQIAQTADERINERIKQLRESAGSIPSAYRRVGNYSIFVFNAPDEMAAAKLIDNVKYEQSIQWLGENPLAWKRYEKQHTREAVSLILGIAKTIGFFVALCLGGGGIVGGLAYLHR